MLIRSLLATIIALGLAGPAIAQFNYHAPPEDAHPLMVDQNQHQLPSLLVLESGEAIETAEDWWERKRPELVQQWKQILGKTQPSGPDAKWFGDIAQATIVSREQRQGYTRLEIRLAIESDFEQPHLLLIPDKAKPGECPAVIAWTSTSPDYREPEAWWGEWLAQRGYVVLTGWSFIRNYRNETSYKDGAHQLVYDRFGHWLAMGKMLHDVHREIEFLKSLSEVDPERIGFIGFSLSAKTALYVAALVPEVQATVAIDPHIPLYGASNYQAPWYLDFEASFPGIATPNYPDPQLRNTVWSLLDTDPNTPGFERNHHELLAMAAPRALMVIGCSTHLPTAPHSDDAQSIAYVRRAEQVYRFLDMTERFQYVPLTCGHQATHPEIDRAWQTFLSRWLGD